MQTWAGSGQFREALAADPARGPCTRATRVERRGRVANAMGRLVHDQREALLLRVLGASRSVLRKIAATEAIVLAGLASTVGGLLSVIAAFCIVVFFFELPFDPPLLDLLGLTLGTFCVTALFAGVGGAGAAIGAAESPQAALRREPV